MNKIITSVFVIFFFLAGIGIGGYFGVALGTSPSVGQVWAGAKEMQGAITYIDQQKVNEARSLLCNSIKARVLIMDVTQPIKSEVSSGQIEELEKYVFNKEDIKKLRAVCI